MQAFLRAGPATLSAADRPGGAPLASAMLFCARTKERGLAADAQSDTFECVISRGHCRRGMRELQRLGDARNNGVQRSGKSGEERRRRRARTQGAASRQSDMPADGSVPLYVPRGSAQTARSLGCCDSEAERRRREMVPWSESIASAVVISARARERRACASDWSLAQAP